VSVVDQMAQDEKTAAEADPKIYGVVVGRVINPLDPLMLGRVQVQLPSIDGLDLSPWARVATPAASLASGIYWIPNLEDEVLVAFENGEVHAPYIIGCLWSAVMVPPLPSPLPQIRMIRTPLGNQIVFTEAPPTITITTASLTQSIVMTPAGIQIIAGANLINMTPDGITISGTPNLNLVASGQITITAPNVVVTGAASTSVGSPASPCLINGLPVKIN
jgi:phage baseplate assembly protein gpV